MSRKPVVAGDVGGWGSILNDFLSQSLEADGTLKSKLTIGASVGAPAPFTIQHFSVAQINNGNYNDEYIVIGYNTAAYQPPLGAGITTEPVLVMGFEDKFWNSELGKFTYEWYINYQSPDHLTVQNFRPFFTAIARENNTDHRALVVMDVGDSGGKARVVVSGTTLWETDSAKTQYSQPVGINLAGASPVGIGASLAVKPIDINSQAITVRGLNGQVGGLFTVQDFNAVQFVSVGPAGGFQIGAPTGGDKGLGTINPASGYYANGSSGVTKTFSITSTGTITVTNGIITSVTT